MKTTRALVPFLLVSAAGTALAQPGTLPQDDPSMTTPTPEPPPEPPPAPTPPSPPPPAPVVTDDATAGRPVGTSFGIGIGYVFGAGTNIQQPNIASVRLRLASGLTLEPEVVLGTRKQSTDSGGASSDASSTQLTVGTQVRYPLLRRGKFDFEMLGGVRLSMVKDNPDGDDNNATTTTMSLNWGIAVNYWITPHWDFTVGAVNPLLSFTKTSNENAPPLEDSESTTTAVFAAFDPTVMAMMHLFY